MSTAIAILSPTQDEIVKTKNEIEAIKITIESQNKSINDFQEAIALIEQNAKYCPQPGVLQPYDQLTQLLNQQQSEVDKQEKLATAKQALALSQIEQKQRLDELYEYRNHLLYLESEDEWEQFYKPHAEKFRSAFPLKSPIVMRQQQLADLRKDIAEKKAILIQAQEWIDGPTNRKPGYNYSRPFDKPFDVVERLPKTISDLQTRLTELAQAPILESRDYDQKFRQFVKARVKLEQPLSKLLEAQSDYLSAVQQFQAIYGQIQPEILNLDVRALDQDLKQWSLDENNVIKQG